MNEKLKKKIHLAYNWFDKLNSLIKKLRVNKTVVVSTKYLLDLGEKRSGKCDIKCFHMKQTFHEYTLATFVKTTLKLKYRFQ